MKTPNIFKSRSLGCLTMAVSLSMSVFGDDAELIKPDDDIRIRGVFDSNLPNTEKKFALKLILHPHFGDLHRYDYLRIPIGLRYGMSERWELSLEGETYLSHGIGDSGFGGETGFSGLIFSSKYHANFLKRYDWDQAVGFEYVTPMGSPPIEITDGLSHFRPYINFAKRLERNPKARVFWGLGLDLVGETSVEGSFRENKLESDSQSFTVGGVWEGKSVTYTFESIFATSRFIGGRDQDLIFMKPGIIWKVPRKYTFNSNGNWILGLGFGASHGRDGFDYGISAKAKVNLDYKK